MPRHTHDRRAFTLLEMISVVAIIAVLLVAALPTMNGGATQGLLGAADVVAGDLAQARSLAVTYGSKYTVTFSLAGNSYTLEHSGTNPSLGTLPTWTFRAPGDPADEHTVRLSELPRIGTSPPLLYRVTVGGVTSVAATVEFDSLGATTAAAETVVWLTDGNAAAPKFIAVRINAVTGLTTVDDISLVGP